MFQDFIEILVLSAIQGISEFLPISSSAHLIIVSSLYDLKASSLLIDISLHLGSLLAIIFFFRKDLLDLKRNQKLLKLIIIGSVPLIIFGYILHSTELIHLLRNIKVVAWTTLFFGIILYFADQKKTDQNISSNLNIKSIIFIGLFQIIISLQVFFQPVIEIKNGKIALKTKEKILSVIKDVDEVLDIKEQERDIINFIFQDKSYTVVIKHLNREELDPILKQIKSVNQE